MSKARANGSTGARVETVTGAVPLEDLGFVLPHEHLAWGDAGWAHDASSRTDREVVLDAMVAMLAEASRTGVDTVIDPTPAEMGRDVELMAEASRMTGVRVIFGTGIYCRWPTPYFAHRSADELADHFGAELTHGVGPDAARPAFLKLAIESAEFTDHERAALIAASKVYTQAPVPVLVHCQPGAGLAVLRALEDLGVPGDAIVVGHAEGVSDLNHHLEIIEKHGAFVGFDRFGLSALGVTDKTRIGLVAALCALGHAARIHLSHDIAGVSLGRGQAMLEERKREEPAWRVSHLASSVLPALRGAGVSEERIALMTRQAPARWLGGAR